MNAPEPQPWETDPLAELEATLSERPDVSESDLKAAMALLREALALPARDDQGDDDSDPWPVERPGDAA